MACHGEKEMACCVRGYHVYKDISAAAIGEVLMCSREPTNAADRYASTSRLADAIAADSRLADRDPLGSGILLMGFR